jgi:hypothetical protein
MAETAIIAAMPAIKPCGLADGAVLVIGTPPNPPAAPGARLAAGRLCPDQLSLKQSETRL